MAGPLEVWSSIEPALLKPQRSVAIAANDAVAEPPLALRSLRCPAAQRRLKLASGPHTLVDATDKLVASCP
eukprot:7065556-Alexandrium_andersonii.AAC.1